MDTQKKTKQAINKRTVAIGAIGVLLILVIVLSVSLPTPRRSVTAFCTSYKQEDSRLAKSSGDTYSLKPFTHSSSDPQDFANALKNLEKVAPNDIEPDVRTLQQIFEKIDKDPSQAISASLSGLGPESSFASWVDKNCK